MKLAPFRLLLTISLALGALTASARTVKVTDFQPDPADATAAVQAAIDSGAETVQFDYPGHDYIVETITARSNQELVFADRVVIQAKSGSFLSRSAFLFSVKGVQNLTLRGDGKAILRMNKTDYQDPSRYEHSEWRHAIALYGSDNIVIKDLTILASGGDGVYLGARACKNVTLENLHIADHHRQAISVISAENLLIKKCTLINTSGTPPQAGIDFEPNSASDIFVNCVMEDCDIYGNASHGIYFSLGHTSKQPVSITIKNCRIHDNSGGVVCSVPGSGEQALQGAITMIGCTMSAPAGRYPLEIRHQRVDGVQFTLRDCVIDNRANNAAPIMLASSQMDDMDGIDFGNLVVLQPLPRPVFDIMSLGVAAIRPFAGTITVRDDDGQEKQVDFTPIYEKHRGNPEMRSFQSLVLDTKKLVPAATAVVSGNTAQTRGQVELVQYARAGETVDITFKVAWQAKGPIRLPVIIRDANGTDSDRFTIDQEVFTYSFTPKGTGVYTFAYKTNGHAVTVESSRPGWGFSASTGLHLFRSASDLYFVVPAGLRKVTAQISSSMGEPLAVELIDAAGAVRDSTPRFAGMQFVQADREPTTADEVWHLRLHDVFEDHTVRLGAPLRPIVFTHPDNRLVAE